MLFTHVHWKAKRRRRKDESDKTKRRRRKDKKTKAKRRKRQDEKTKAKRRYIAGCKALHVFVISPSLFRYVAFVISLFRYVAFVFSLFRYGAFVMSPRNNEKTKWHESATILTRYRTIVLAHYQATVNMLSRKRAITQRHYCADTLSQKAEPLIRCRANALSRKHAISCYRADTLSRKKLLGPVRNLYCFSNTFRTLFISYSIYETSCVFLYPREFGDGIPP